jgi:hypothetical protein
VLGDFINEGSEHGVGVTCSMKHEDIAVNPRPRQRRGRDAIVGAKGERGDDRSAGRRGDQFPNDVVVIATECDSGNEPGGGTQLK